MRAPDKIVHTDLCTVALNVEILNFGCLFHGFCGNFVLAPQFCADSFCSELVRI